MAILYITPDDVKVRLAGKVRFTDNIDKEPDKMPNRLLERLIAESEAEVEQELSQRYFIPFQTCAGEDFKKLPDRPTKEYLRTMCELKAVMRVLGTDFGSGTATEGDNYYKNISERYDKMKDMLMERRGGSYNNFLYPPLLGLKLNFHNHAADDGYSGAIWVTSQGDGDFAQKQINDPSENFWNGVIDGVVVP